MDALKNFIAHLRPATYIGTINRTVIAPEQHLNYYRWWVVSIVIGCSAILVTFATSASLENLVTDIEWNTAEMVDPLKNVESGVQIVATEVPPFFKSTNYSLFKITKRVEEIQQDTDSINRVKLASLITSIEAIKRDVNFVRIYVEDVFTAGFSALATTVGLMHTQFTNLLTRFNEFIISFDQFQQKFDERGIVIDTIQRQVLNIEGSTAETNNLLREILSAIAYEEETFRKRVRRALIGTTIIGTMEYEGAGQFDLLPGEFTFGGEAETEVEDVLWV